MVFNDISSFASPVHEQSIVAQEVHADGGRLNVGHCKAPFEGSS